MHIHVFDDLPAALLPNLQRLRRDLHATPEVGLHLPLTQARVLADLEGLGLEITLGQATTSITAVLRGGRPGPSVLLCADMDALPLAEETGLPYAARGEAMHACGHDLHTAALVGAARLLAARRDELAGSVVFMFQTGEEGLGGSRYPIAEGVLDAAGSRVVAAYAIHVFTGTRGVFKTRPGAIMASAARLHITVHGQGGHGSQPWTALDPVPALLEIGTALHALPTRRFAPTDPVVLSVTQLAAGSAVNIIPEKATLGATVRTLSPETTDLFGEEVVRLAEGIAQAHGCRAEVDFDPYYPATINDPDEARLALATLAATFGDDRVYESESSEMASEDFSFVLREVPGAYIMLGATPSGIDPETAPMNHSPRVLFDDTLLGDMAAALATLAWGRLEADQARKG